MRFHGGVTHPNAIPFGHPIRKIALFLDAHVVLLEARKANDEAVIVVQMGRKDSADGSPAFYYTVKLFHSSLLVNEWRIARRPVPSCRSGFVRDRFGRATVESTHPVTQSVPHGR